jgi:hypothetical protein
MIIYNLFFFDILLMLHDDNIYVFKFTFFWGTLTHFHVKTGAAVYNICVTNF